MLMMIFRPEGLLPRRLGGRGKGEGAKGIDIRKRRAGESDDDRGGVQGGVSNG